MAHGEKKEKDRNYIHIEVTKTTTKTTFIDN